MASVSRTTPRDHDLLSFLALVIRKYNNSLSLSVTVLCVLLSEGGPRLHHHTASGSFFRISILEFKPLLEGRALGMDYGPLPDWQDLPRAVAVKVPRITGDPNGRRSRQIWNSMAKELQVLKNSFLSRHDNIVTLQGVCWSQVGTGGDMGVMPALVLEAADFGNMEYFLNLDPEISLLKLLGLCVDVAAGIEALHDVGIIHGDLKPQNILIFHHDTLEMVAKLADFGSCVFLTEVDEPVQLQSTPRWRAPECDRPVRKEDLKAVDAYALGLIVANTITRNGISRLFKLPDADLRDMDHTTFTQCVTLSVKEAVVTRNPKNGNKLPETKTADGPVPQDRDDEQEDSYFEIAEELAYLVLATILPNNRSETSLVRPKLRELLARAVRIRLIRDPFDMSWNFNSQEADAGFQTGLNNLNPTDAEKETALFSPNAVLEADRSMGTLAVLPIPALKQIESQFKRVARDDTQDRNRRSRSAFQFAIMTLSQLQSYADDARIAQILDLLLLAAELQHEEARGIVEWLFRTFERQMPDRITAPCRMQWLRDAACSGSTTALRLLERLDPDIYTEARRILRTERAGLGISINEAILPWGDKECFVRVDIASSLEMRNLLAFFAQTDRLAGIAHLLRRDPSMLNEKGAGDETALLIACRCGHVETARFLLDKGADAGQKSIEGVTPLHLLSSFPAGEIPEIAKALVRRGATLQARSTGSHRYYLSIDGIYGDTNGTPLTWAVAANNIAAVEALVRLGADPFDHAASSVPVDNNFTTLVHTSPILYAVMTHRWQLLEVMLPQTQDWARELNRNDRVIGTDRVEDPFTQLDYCVQSSVDGVLKRLLTHGKDHEEAFRKTFELLTERGADPFASGQPQDSVLVTAVQWGHTWTVRYLLSWAQGRLRPTPSAWIKCLATAATTSNKPTFDALMEQPPSEVIPLSEWTRYFATVADLTNDVGFLQPLVQHLDPEFDFTPYLRLALERGNFETVRWLYSFARCNISGYRLDENGFGASILGRLLVDSKQYTFRSMAVQTLLGLPNLSDDIFFHTAQLGGSVLSALHLAAYNTEYQLGSAPDSTAFSLVLVQFGEPDYLDLQVREGTYKGYTAVHFAVGTCNEEALRMLIEEDANLSIPCARNETPLDHAMRNFGNQNGRLEMWEVPPAQRMATGLKHFQRSLAVLAMLKEAGAEPNKFLAVVVRTEPHDLVLLPAQPDTERPILIMPYIPRPLPPMLADSPFFDAASCLDVDSCFYIANGDVTVGDDRPYIGASVTDWFNRILGPHRDMMRGYPDQQFEEGLG